MTGYARRYVNQFGWTMAFAVMVSMLVSFTLTPMLSSRMLKRLGDKRKNSDEAIDSSVEPAGSQSEHTSKDSRFFGWIDRTYGRILEWSLNHRIAVVAVALATFALTFPLNALVGRDFIPPDDQSEFQVSLNWPEGTSVKGTPSLPSDDHRRFPSRFVNPTYKAFCRAKPYLCSAWM